MTLKGQGRDPDIFGGQFYLKWPRKVKFVTQICFGPIISKLAGDKLSGAIEHLQFSIFC